MICEYGCRQEAKYYFPTVNKWCCSSHFSKCPKRVDNFSGENNPMYGKESSFKGKHHSNESIEKMRKNSGVLKGKTYEEIYGKKKAKELKKIRSVEFSKQRKGKTPWNKNKTKIYSEETLHQMSIEKTYTIEDYKDKHPEFYEIDRPIFKNNKLYVKCKHCQKIFVPEKSQINERLRSIRTKIYKNFLFCSKSCKQNSDFFNRQVDPKTKTKFQEYSNKVWRLTNQTLKKHKIKDIELRGRNKYHLDHKYSILEGFKNDINPKLISHHKNLQMLPERKNIQKGSSCSISLQELQSYS